MSKLRSQKERCSLIILFLVAILLSGCSPGEQMAVQSTQPVPVQKASLKCFQQVGITLSGAEWEGDSYIRPTKDELRYYASKGVRLIRLEIRWDRFQPNFYDAVTSDSDEVKWLKGFIGDANSLHLSVDIDLHERSNLDDLNFGADLPIAALVDFWKKMATILRDVPGICGYGIANEPNHDPGFLGKWPGEANAVIAAIHSIDPSHFIFVPEDNWDSSQHWKADQAKQIQGGTQVVYEAHSYWDKDESGNYEPNVPPVTSTRASTLVMKNLKPFINWCSQTKSKCFVGEFGVPPDRGWLDALDTALSYMKQNKIGGAYWAGGPGWGTDYLLSIEPVPLTATSERPQMKVLEKYLTE